MEKTILALDSLTLKAWDEVKIALQRPVRDYYDSLAKLNEGGGVFRNVTNRIRRTLLKQNLRLTLRQTVEQAHVDEARRRLGVKQLTPRQYNQIQPLIGRQLQYLAGFLNDVDTMTPEQAIQRIALYANAVLQTGSFAVALVLPRLPIYPGDTSLKCEGFCRCSLSVVRVGDGDYNVYWLLDPLGREHCEDCLKLAAEWSPLEVRGGVISVRHLTAKQKELIMMTIRYMEIGQHARFTN